MPGLCSGATVGQEPDLSGVSLPPVYASPNSPPPPPSPGAEIESADAVVAAKAESVTAVRVVVRVRPLIARETVPGAAKPVLTVAPPNALKLLDESKAPGDAAREREFVYDAVLAPAALVAAGAGAGGKESRDKDANSQAAAFESAARPILSRVLEGYNGTIFAYGQTGSGKTFSMEGASSTAADAVSGAGGAGAGASGGGASRDAEGIIPRLCRELIESLDSLDARAAAGAPAAGAAGRPPRALAPAPAAGKGAPAAPRAGGTSHSYTLTVSYVEIYNEKMYDLLRGTPSTAAAAFTGLDDSGGSSARGSSPAAAPASANSRSARAPSASDAGASSGDDEGPRIRQTAGGVIFLEGAVTRLVRSADDVATILVEGQARRTKGETNMNAMSSRSHAVLTLQVVVTRTDSIAPPPAPAGVGGASASAGAAGGGGGDAGGGGAGGGADDAREPGGETIVTTRTSKLSLIDLAGSERADSTGATGARLKEGANINLSLSCLGRVINALTTMKEGAEIYGRPGADAGAPDAGSLAKGSVVHVPYRDSKLTRLLQDSLGGSAVTCMLACVSPAAVNLDETLATLRFAARAKKVTNVARLNVDPREARLAALVAEARALRERLALYEGALARRAVPRPVGAWAAVLEAEGRAADAAAAGGGAGKGAGPAVALVGGGDLARAALRANPGAVAALAPVQPGGGGGLRSSLCVSAKSSELAEPVGARTRAQRAQATADRTLFVLGLAVANGYEEDAGVCVGLCRQSWREGFLLTAARFEAGKRARKAALAWAAAAPARAAARAARAHARFIARAGAAASWDERDAADKEDDAKEHACLHQATRLHSAARYGRVDRVRELLRSGAAINARDKWGCTPLYHASQFGRAAVVAVLLATPGVAVNAAAWDVATPLYAASMVGHAPVVAALLAAPGIALNAWPSLLNGHRASLGTTSTHGMSPLYIASANDKPAAVAALLAAPGVIVNVADDDGMTPLHFAALNGFTAVASALLAHPAVDVNSRTAGMVGSTPLSLARAEGHPVIAARLEARGGVVRSRSLDRLAARVLVACAAAASLAAAARVPGSPLPVPAAGLNASSALYYITVVDSAEQTPADALTLSTLQGALARVSGRPVLVRAQPGSSYALWFTELSSFWGVALNSSFFDGQSVFDILAHFNASLQGGYIVADLNDGSVNAAVALAASRADGAVVVTADNAPKAAAAGLRLLADVTGRDLAWVLSSIGTAPFSKKVTLVQDPSKTGMADWAIATGALTWIVPNASAGALAAQVWGALEPPFFALGWGEDEFWTVRAASAAGGGVIASDWATNLDVFSAYDSPGFSQRAQASPAAAPQLTAIAAAPPARHTAAFLFSDGDNVQWILGGFATSPSFFGSPDRGRVPLGWTLSPALADLAPVAMRYLYAAASDVDVFVGALSGAAYSYSDVDAAAPGWADKLALNLAYARKAGMSYSNVMTTGTALPPAVAAGLLAADSPLQGLFHYSYSNYSLGGGVSFVGRKPVIQARFNLWGDGSQGSNFYNVRQSIDALVAAPRDPSVAAGYSLIVVHAWSHNVTDARAVMDGVLARVPPGAVAFVTPDELARQVAANVAA